MAPAPKPTTSVTNPLAADLDAAGHNLNNVGMITAQANVQSSGYVVGDKVVATSGEVILEPAGTNTVSILAGLDDPAATAIQANMGTLYIRTVPAQLWQKTGPTNSEWTQRS